MKPVLGSAFCLWISFQLWLPVFLEQNSRVSADSLLPKADYGDAGKGNHKLGGNRRPSSTTGLVMLMQASFLALLGAMITHPGLPFLSVRFSGIPRGGSNCNLRFYRPVVYARYFMFSQVFVIVAASVLVCRLPRLRLILVPVLLAIAAFPCHTHYTWRAANASLPGMQGAVAKRWNLRNDPTCDCE
ncbi:MAG: hypothetical protein R3C59_28750 [Planctomycetaceae bacterium]